MPYQMSEISKYPASLTAERATSAGKPLRRLKEACAGEPLALGTVDQRRPQPRRRNRSILVNHRPPRRVRAFRLPRGSRSGPGSCADNLKPTGEAEGSSALILPEEHPGPVLFICVSPFPGARSSRPCVRCRGTPPLLFRRGDQRLQASFRQR